MSYRNWWTREELPKQNSHHKSENVRVRDSIVNAFKFQEQFVFVISDLFDLLRYLEINILFGAYFKHNLR